MRITYLELLNKIKNKEINPYNYYIIDDSVTYIYDGLEFVDKNNTTLLSKYAQSQNSIMYSLLSVEKQPKGFKNHEDKIIRRAKKDIIEELWDMYLRLDWNIDACQGCMEDLDKQFKKVNLYQNLLEYMGVNVKEQRDEKFSKWYQEQIERQNKEDEKKKEFKKSIYNPITIPFDILTESFENKDNESLKLIVDTCQKINDLLKYLKNKNI
jgi:hypothetical protein